MLDVHHPRSFALPLGLAVELRVQVGGHQQHDRVQTCARPDRGRLVGVTHRIAEPRRLRLGYRLLNRRGCRFLRNANTPALAHSNPRTPGSGVAPT